MSQNVLIQNEQVVGAGVSSASQISYDNSGTSLPNNVQGAISSLNVNLTNTLTQFKTNLQDIMSTNGFMNVRIPAGTNIGGYVIQGNMRGYFVNDNGTGNGIIMDYNISLVLAIACANGSWSWRQIYKYS